MSASLSSVIVKPVSTTHTMEQLQLMYDVMMGRLHSIYDVPRNDGQVPERMQRLWAPQSHLDQPALRCILDEEEGFILTTMVPQTRLLVTSVPRLPRFTCKRVVSMSTPSPSSLLPLLVHLPSGSVLAPASRDTIESGIAFWPLQWACWRE